MHTRLLEELDLARRRVHETRMEMQEAHEDLMHWVWAHARKRRDRAKLLELETKKQAFDERRKAHVEATDLCERVRERLAHEMARTRSFDDPGH